MRQPSWSSIACWTSLLAAALRCVALPARAEMSEINVAQQYGISYLPLMIMEDQKLIEKHAKAAGVDVKVGWAKFAGGNVMNDALLSNSLQFASGGVGPLVTLWARTRATSTSRRSSAINSMPLTSTRAIPNVKTIKDFTEKDKIALPAVKVSIQAVTLQMAAEKAFGEGQQNKLDRADRLDVAPGRADGAAVRRSPRSPRTSARRRSSTSSSRSPASTRCSTRTTCWAARRRSTSCGRRRSSAARIRSSTTAFVKALDEATAIINRDKKARGRDVPAHVEGQGHASPTSWRC